MSFAMLPFDDLAGPEHETLCQGLTGDLTAKLARLPQFMVTPRNLAAAALDSLDRAYARHETDDNFVAVEPLLDPLRSEAGFIALKRRMGL